MIADYAVEKLQLYRFGGHPRNSTFFLYRAIVSMQQRNKKTFLMYLLFLERSGGFRDPEKFSVQDEKAADLIHLAR